MEGECLWGLVLVWLRQIACSPGLWARVLVPVKKNQGRHGFLVASNDVLQWVNENEGKWYGRVSHLDQGGWGLTQCDTPSNSDSK